MKDLQVRGDYKSKVSECNICEIPRRQKTDCFYMKNTRVVVASMKRDAELDFVVGIMPNVCETYIHRLSLSVCPDFDPHKNFMHMSTLFSP